MIYIHEISLRVVGNRLRFFGKEYSVQDFIEGGTAFIDDVALDKYQQVKTILLTNTNWGRKESQWEDALDSKDAEILALLASQGYSLNKVAEEALNFPKYIAKIHEAIYHILRS